VLHSLLGNQALSCSYQAVVLCRVFAELRSYVDPPELVLHVVQALLNLLNPDKNCETWAQCKQVCVCGVGVLCV